MMIYSCGFGPTAETVAVDFVELTPATNRTCAVLRATIGQTTEVGDAQEEFIGITWIRGNTTSGSGGVAAAAGRAQNPNYAASGFTYEALNTTQASSGTAVTVRQDVWSIRGGYDKVYLPEERPEVSAANTLMCLRLGAAPADSITMAGEVIVAEF